MEAALYVEREARPDADLADLAGRFATTPRRGAREIVGEARAEFASFSEDLDELCR